MQRPEVWCRARPRVTAGQLGRPERLGPLSIPAPTLQEATHDSIRHRTEGLLESNYGRHFISFSPIKRSH